MPGVLFARFSSVAALTDAWRRLQENDLNDGVVAPGVARFAEAVDANLSRLSAELEAGSWTPDVLTVVEIPQTDGVRTLRSPAPHNVALFLSGSSQPVGREPRQTWRGEERSGNEAAPGRPASVASPPRGLPPELPNVTVPNGHAMPYHTIDSFPFSDDLSRARGGGPAA